jgi:hypothetical protein
VLKQIPFMLMSKEIDASIRCPTITTNRALANFDHIRFYSTYYVLIAIYS